MDTGTQVGDIVAGGSVAEEYDVGRALALEEGGTIAIVAWQWPVTRTREPVAMLRPEDPRLTERMRAALAGRD